MKTVQYQKSHGLLLMLGLLSLALLLAACASDPTDVPSPSGTSEQPAPEIPESTPLPEVGPVELTVFYPFGDSSPESFMETYGGLIQKYHPTISFEWLNTKNMSLTDLAATGKNVDIFMSNANSAATLASLGYAADMSDYVRKYNFDLNIVEPAALDIIRNVNNGELSALPIFINQHLLFYNRDLFEKFAIDYPVNGMTWDDTYELARRMTRVENDVQYYGFHYEFLAGTFAYLNSYGQNLIDPNTGEVTFENPVWVDMLQNFKRFYEITGNEYSVVRTSPFREEKLAMSVTLSNRVTGNPAYVPPNWDVASLPVFNDLPGVGSGVEPIYFYLSATAKHPDEAFLAITSLLNEDNQIEQARLGRMPSIRMTNLEQIMATEVASLQGKNVAALFYNQYAPSTTLTADTIAIRPHLGQATTKIMDGDVDVNSALREAAELARGTIAERRAAENP